MAIRTTVSGAKSVFLILLIILLASISYADWEAGETNPMLSGKSVLMDRQVCIQKYGAAYCKCTTLQDGTEACYYERPPAGYYTLQECERVFGAGNCVCENGVCHARSSSASTMSCLGNIYIFNGAKWECRKAGVKTLFTNCCHHDSSCEPQDIFFGLLQCKEEDALTACKDQAGFCHFLDEDCDLEIFGVCLQKIKIFCCYNSKLARIVNEQGRIQLGRPFQGEDDDCRGFTPEEFQKLDFTRMDLSEFYDDVNRRMATNIEQRFQQKIQEIQRRF